MDSRIRQTVTALPHGRALSLDHIFVHYLNIYGESRPLPSGKTSPIFHFPKGKWLR